jgi:hypothetical protein
MSEVKQQREVCLAQVKVFTKPSRCKVWRFWAYVLFGLEVALNCALMIHPLTKRPGDISTRTECPPNASSAVTFYQCNILTLYCFTTTTLHPCNVLLLRHFVFVMFYHCDTQSL